MIGVGVDGTASGRDAVALGSLLARQAAAELMLIAIHQEPLAEQVEAQLRGVDPQLE